MKQMYPQMIMGNGILTDLSDFAVPWQGASYVSELDIGYYSHSAQKIISPIVFDISGNELGTDLVPLTERQRTILAGMLFRIYNRKWDKLWDVYNSTYNPINNYQMSETETIDRDVTRSGTEGGTVNNANTGTIEDVGTDTGTVTNANTGTVADNGTDTGTVTTVTDREKTNTGTESNSGTSNTQDGIFGFNSATAVGSDTSDNTNTNTRTDNLSESEDTSVTETRNISNANTRTLNTSDLETRNLANGNTRTLNTSDLETRNLTHSDTESDDTSRETTREGLTGIYTPQQMLNAEIELWQWNFFKQVFEDIDAILCLEIY